MPLTTRMKTGVLVECVEFAMDTLNPSLNPPHHFTTKDRLLATEVVQTAVWGTRSFITFWAGWLCCGVGTLMTRG